MFYDNLKGICNSKNIKITPLVLECGGTKGALSGWKRGVLPNSDIVMKLSVRLNVPSDVLLFGKEKSSPTNDLSADERELLTYYKKLPDKEQGKLLGRAEALAEAAAENHNTKPEIQMSAEPDPTPEKIYIEFYDLPVSAGTGIYLDNSDCDMLEVDETPLTAEANFALKIQGDSMKPKFSDGDIILIRTQPCVEIGEIGTFIINNTGYVKKFEGDRLVSLNQKYDDIVFEEYDEIYCKGKVLGKL